MEKEAVVPQQPIIEVPAKQQGIFDHRTHIRDANTGRMVGYQPYARHSFDDKILLERPVGSGNMYNPNGEPCGRWEPSKQQPGHFNKIGDTHAYVAPPPRNKQEAMEQENAALRAELEAIKGGSSGGREPTGKRHAN